MILSPPRRGCAFRGSPRILAGKARHSEASQAPEIHSATPAAAGATDPATDASSAATATSPPSLVKQPAIASVPNDIPAYNRDEWRHWSDADGDCQNTRAEVLISESLSAVTFTPASGGCTVSTGLWIGPFTGRSFTQASDVDVDHMVPLKNAHDSGGWAWSAQKKKEYANNLSNVQHLVAVDDGSNQAKGARGPEEWMPPLAAYWCQYAADWIEVKNVWGLSATVVEWTALQSMLTTCPGGAPVTTPSPVSVTQRRLQASAQLWMPQAIRLESEPASRFHLTRSVQIRIAETSQVGRRRRTSTRPRAKATPTDSTATAMELPVSRYQERRRVSRRTPAPRSGRSDRDSAPAPLPSAKLGTGSYGAGGGQTGGQSPAETRLLSPIRT